MQLFTTVLALVAANFMAAEAALVPVTPHVTWDCYQETAETYGNPAGNKVSDKNNIAGLDIQNSKLTAISACTELSTGLISGITTTWGIWDSATSAWTNVKRMNKIGKMSGVQEFNDQQYMSGITYTAALDQAVAKYWYQEAAPAQEQWYADQTSFRAASSTVNTAWTNDRKAIWQTYDTSVGGNGVLTRTQAIAFLGDIRLNKDGRTVASDNMLLRVENQWDLLKQFTQTSGSTPESISFNDYVRGEQIMTAWYAAGKLAVTGHARNTSGSPGDDLSHKCTTLRVAQDDSIGAIAVYSGLHGVEGITVQTAQIPSFDLGSWSISNSADSSRYSYRDTNWQRYDANTFFYGLWGTENSTTGKLNSIGFVEKDEPCYQQFYGLLLGSTTWTSTKIPSLTMTAPTLDTQYSSYIAAKPTASVAITNPFGSGTGAAVASVPTPPAPSPGTIVPTASTSSTTTTTTTSTATSTVSASTNVGADKLIPAHEHDDDAEAGLVVFAIIVWVLVAILIIAFIFQYCNDKKRAGNSVAYEERR